MLIGFNSLFFWQRFKLVLNEGVITSAYLSLNRAHTSLWQWLIRIFYRLADVIIVPTRACRKDLVDHFRLPKNKITVIPYWTLFKPLAPARKRYDLLYAGRFEKEKNIPDILSLAKVLKPAFPRLRVCLIGEGKLKSVIQNQVVTQGLADTVSLLSPTAHVARFLSRSKVLVLPTLNEGMPNIILEAAMCQVPTVSYRYPGVEEVILDRKTGYITQGIEETATKLNRLLTKPKLLNRLGKNAQRFVQAHAAQAQQQRFIDVLIST
jgi:glycosyltransferase involved in cell wall biosynthesis